ncbi:N-6 DNA methylase [uncultured Bacteroides sp.]|uniref:Eco57I restriction-modification methylase domain-containing protein n=1 Tax=uncultured Bacteroides sp. TaxID=162156 RepID=UPI00261ECE12|nr:N-6 DNA methylase [uncultured Bacteroides sp.]
MMDFSKKYNRDEFMKFLQNEFLPEDVSFTTDPEVEKQEKTKYIKAITKLGTCPSLRLAVYEARHTSPNDARVGLSKEIFRFMDNKRERRALVLFVPEENGANYRFSLISIDLRETKDGKIQHGYSNPRRYSYYLGEGVAHRTPDDYLKKRSRVKDADDLTSRFAVEILNKAFFDEYKGQYQKFCKFLNENPEMRRSFQDFSDNGKAIRDYVKKMLGRIVFLYFVQRKGWLDGNYRYMSDLFAHAAADVQSDFLDRVLEPMFFGLLNTPKAERIAHAEKNGWDFSLIPGWENIPYLNGGLFEQDEIDKCKSVFPKEYFAALFDFFDTYNFTIDENDPDDNEVGIDPEMLGHIFENLLEDNKDKGAFYTPKEIVQYMSRESIIQYLKTHEPDARYAEVIEHLIRNGEVDKELQDKATAVQFTKWLSEVKVCDPAIGSGAFPMGVLNVLYHSRQLLYGFTKANTAFSPAEVKREIIQNNIYGVDIEQGAVDIARLRFWLSLVVDEDRPQALPNLDYKIMQGNSLLESFMGYDLSRLLPINKDGKTSKRATQPSANDIQIRLVFELEQDSIAEIQRLMRLYYSPEKHEQKEQLKREIDTLVKEHIVICSGNTPAVREAVDRIADNNKPFFLWHLYFADVFQKGGFDIVIGNPPYGANIDASAEILKKTYPRTSHGYIDVYKFFFDRSLSLLQNNGALCFITPNTFLRQPRYQDIRDLLLENNILILNDLGEDVFEAVVPTAISLVQKARNKNNCVFFADLTKEENIKTAIERISYTIIQQQNFQSTANHIFIRDIREKRDNEFLLEEILNMKDAGINYQRVKVGLAQKGKSDLSSRLLYEGTKESDEHIMFWKGADIDEFFVANKIERYVRPNISLASNERIILNSEYFSISPKLIWRQTAPYPICTIDYRGVWFGRSIQGGIIKSEFKSIVSYEYLCALLNSKYIRKLYENNVKEEGRVFPQVKLQKLKSLPVIIPENQSPYIDLVKTIIGFKQENPDTDISDYKSKIDLMVYRLYGLTYDEVKIIDPATPITREEYENFNL